MISYEAIIGEIPQLSIEERKMLVAVIVDSLAADTTDRTLNLLDFEGVGENLRDEIDAQEYVNRLRDEWNDRL